MKICNFCILPILSFLLILPVQSVQCEEGESSLPQSNLTKVIDLAKNAVESYPDVAQSYIALGGAYSANLMYEQAIQAYKKVLTFDSQNPQILSTIGELYKKMNDHENAVQWFQKAIKVIPQLPNVNEFLGLSLVQLNRMKEAREAFERHIKYYPQDYSAHFYLAQRYFDEENYEKAETHARICADLDTRVSEPYYLLGKIFRKRGDKEKAKEILQFFKQKKKEEYEIIDSMEEESSERKEKNIHSQIHLLYAQAAIQHQDWSVVETHLRNAIELNPNNHEAKSNLITLLQKQNRYNETEAFLKQEIENNPENFQYRLMLGMVHIKNQNYDEAIDILDTALMIQPNSINAKRILAEMLLRTNRDSKRALDLLIDVTKEKQTVADLDLLSWAYFNNGKIQKCLDTLEKAMKKDPNNQNLQNRYIKIRSRLRQMQSEN